MSARCVNKMMSGVRNLYDLGQKDQIMRTEVRECRKGRRASLQWSKIQERFKMPFLPFLPFLHFVRLRDCALCSVNPLDSSYL
jgi:hypothetical protein